MWQIYGKTYVNFRHISDKSQEIIRQITGISHANIMQNSFKSNAISCKSHANLMQISGKFQKNIMQMSALSQVNLWQISGKSHSNPKQI